MNRLLIEPIVVRLLHVFNLKTIRAFSGIRSSKNYSIFFHLTIDILIYICYLCHIIIKDNDMGTKHFKVEFKETYFPHAVERECWVTDEQEVIKIYGLDQSDIEWYKITEI